MGNISVSLDDVVKVPDNIFSKTFPEGDLHIAKENPSWILTNNIETLLLHELHKKKTIREAANSVYNTKKLSVKKIEDSTKTLLQKIDEFGFFEGATVPDDGKLAMHLYLTNECNLRCRHCYKNAGIKKDNELSFDEIKKLIDDFSLQGCSQIVLSGGEVLKRNDFFEIAKHIRSKGHKVNMVTNGILIGDRDTAKKLSTSVDFLQISLDGASREKNDYYRGKGTFDKIINAINLFSGLDFVVNIGMVVSEINYRDIKENLAHLLFEKIEHNKIKLNVSGLMDYGRGQYCKSHNSADYVEKVFKIAAELGINQKQWRLPNTKAYDCGYARSITVDSNGDVYYCPIANQQLNTQMNVRTTPFNEIITHFIEKNKSISVEYIELCNDCELEYLCGGGCRLENEVKRGDLLMPECSPTKKTLIYNELIKLRT